MTSCGAGESGPRFALELLAAEGGQRRRHDARPIELGDRHLLGRFGVVDEEIGQLQRAELEAAAARGRLGSSVTSVNERQVFRRHLAVRALLQFVLYPLAFVEAREPGALN